MSVSLESKFTDLQKEFRNNLLVTLSHIESLWSELIEKNNKETLKKLHNNLIRLADAGGTYGADEVSYLARKLDLKLKPLLNEDELVNIQGKEQKKLSELFKQLKQKLRTGCLQMFL